MSTQPFKTFVVQPAYGFYRAAVNWELSPTVTGNVYFYRSESGLAGSWTLLNPNAPATGSSGQFLDNAMPGDNMNFIHYRGLVDDGGPPEGWLKGPDVTALDSLSRREYMLTREIMRREYQAMSGPYGNGLRALHYVPKTTGAAAPHTDPETGQVLGPDCPDAALKGYGTLWAGGFHPPVQTWVRLVTMTPQGRPDREDATGAYSKSDVHLRLLAYPKPDKGHVIVLPASDRRYVIGASVLPFFLRGAVPVFWEADASLLNNDDIRYLLPLPELLADG